MLKNKEALKSIIARYLDCTPESISNDPNLYIEDVSMSDIVLMVQEIVGLVVQETILNSKSHSDCPADTDWDGARVNTSNQLSLY